MRSICAIRYGLGAAAVLAMLSGCSGGSSQFAATPGPATGAGGQSILRQSPALGFQKNSLLPRNTARLRNAPIMSPTFMDSAASLKPLIFVSDPSRNTINIYPQSGKNQKMVGQITKLNQPQGITTDAQGNLYVANTNSSNVLIFAPPYTKAPTLTLSAKGEFPVDVAVSPTGVVAVTNICNAPACTLSTGSVSFYAKGSTKPCATVADASQLFAQFAFATFDKNNALYVGAQNTAYGSELGFIEGGCKATSIINISPQLNGPGSPGGMQIDAAGNFVVVDTVNQDVLTFAPSVGGSQLGTPIATTPTFSSGYPLGLALLASAKSLYTADPTGTGIVNEYAYTAGGSPDNTLIDNGQPIGVAVTPIAKL